MLKRREQSIYKPTDIWTEYDDVIFLRYCPSKRMKCYHAISRDTRSNAIGFTTLDSDVFDYLEVDDL